MIPQCNSKSRDTATLKSVKFVRTETDSGVKSVNRLYVVVSTFVCVFVSDGFLLCDAAFTSGSIQQDNSHVVVQLSTRKQQGCPEQMS